MENIQENINFVSSLRDLPIKHKEYLVKIKNDYGFYPKTIYDIGACVLHWTQEAQQVWPKSKIILFDATNIFEELYINKRFSYNIGVVGKKNNEVVKFYQNNEMFAGNSYYRENPKYNPTAELLYDDSKILELKTETLDTIVNKKLFKYPELIKIDVQGAELDVLIGANETLKNCEHLIIELRDIEYNIGSPEKTIIIEYLDSQGFKNMGMFCDNGPDGDYHFIKK